MNKLAHLNTLKPLTFMDDEEIKASFKKLYLATHAGETDDDAENFYERESNYFKRIIFGSKDLQQATMFSLYGCLMDIITNGLSFDPSANLVYVTIRNFNTAQRGQADQWEKRASNTISPYGELTLRIKYGQVKYIDTPVVVFEGDLFKKGYNEDGKQYIRYEAQIPRCTNNIVAGFVKVVRPDGTFDFPHMDSMDIERLKNYSVKQNKKVTDLYGGSGENATGVIDTGFFKAKLIRHAFKAFPKVKILGGHSSFEEDAEITSTVQVLDADGTKQEDESQVTGIDLKSKEEMYDYSREHARQTIMDNIGDAPQDYDGFTDDPAPVQKTSNPQPQHGNTLKLSSLDF